MDPLAAYSRRGGVIGSSQSRSHWRRALLGVPAAHGGGSPGEDGDALLARYAGSRDAVLREQILTAFTPLIDRIMLDFNFSGAPVEDLKQVGYLGLLNAIEVFDPARGVKFKTYASHLIRGEIRHYLRDQHDTIRQPRWLRKLNQQIEQAVGGYLHRHGRFPRVGELASEFNVEEEGLLEVLKTREALRTVPLSTSEEGDEVSVDRSRIRHKAYVAFQLPIEDRIVLYEAIEKLSLVQRRVLYYLFFRDLTHPEAARRVGISQRHLSRVLAKSLNRLRGLVTR